MSFNSFIFILAFLPVTLFIYWMLRKYHHYVISVWFVSLASFAYYAFCYPKGAIVLALSMGINYIISLNILRKRHTKLLLAMGIVFDVLLLSFFKYGGFIFSFVGTTLTAPGISFYTFTEIALLVECYRGTVLELAPEEYCLLITFFPKMMEGPVVTPKDMFPQNVGRTSIDAEKIYRAVMLFTFGMFKKVIIADTLGAAVDYGFADLNSMHSGEALVIMLSYTLQLYFDFSGYCDMGLSIASLFGFDLPINFNSPYKARNIVDFWKRWHITLTNFFTRYIYIPLGGSRKGYARKYLNILIIFFISGLWHGAGFQFIIWGLMHGVLFMLLRFVEDRTGKEYLFEGKLWRVLSTAFTFLYVNVAWVFFRAPSVSDALHLFGDFFEFWFPRFNTGLAKCFNLDELWYVLKVLHLDSMSFSLYILMALILIALVILIFAAPNAIEYSTKCKINLANTLMITVLFIWALLSFEGVATYLYVNF